MKKVALIAIVILAGGLTYVCADELENLKNSSLNIEQVNLTDLQKPDEKTSKEVDINVDVIFPAPNYPPLPVYPPQPYPYPQPGYQQGVITFQSGEFRFASEAEKSMDYAVAALKNRGFNVLESNRDWAKYKIVFMAPAFTQVQRYASQTYTFHSDAEKGLKQAVQSFEATGAVILEQNLQWDYFVIQYLMTAPQPYPPYPPYPVYGYRTACSVTDGRATGTVYNYPGGSSFSGKVYFYYYDAYGRMIERDWTTGIFIFVGNDDTDTVTDYSVPSRAVSCYLDVTEAAAGR